MVTVLDPGDPTVTLELEGTFKEYARMIYRTAYGVTGSREDAEDVLQTIFLRLLRREFSSDLGSNPKAYLYRAAVNLSLDTLRSRRRHPLVDVEHLEVAAPSGDPLIDDELHQRLYASIAKLKPDVAQMLILRYVHNYSDAEIARMLGKSRGSVALKLFRSRARLKKLLSRQPGGPS